MSDTYSTITETNTLQSIEEIKQYIEEYFTNAEYSYHSLAHTMNVFDAVGKIAEYEEIAPDNIRLLQIAALFHDTGYASDPERHEEISATNAENYLLTKEYSPEDIGLIKQLIMATRMEHDPQIILEGIIKDADLSHLGKRSFKKSSHLLRKEKEYIEKRVITDVEWLHMNLDFLGNHSWYTKGGKKLFNKNKKENVSSLKEQLKAIQKQEAALKPEKGVETMYRVALRNHNQLSKIADNKANIMLSITAIMLSLILSSLAPKIDSNQRLLIPTILIIIVNLITMFFAIMATRPKVSSAPYSREKFLSNKINLLFFGNFYKIPLEEFEWGMEKLREDRDLLYGSLSKDLYFLGSVLAKKYKFLQYAYAVFMAGLIISTVAFILAFTL